MTKTIFRTTITPILVCFFIIASISPIIESITLKRIGNRDTANVAGAQGSNSISDANMYRDGCEKLVSNTHQSWEVPQRPGLLTNRGYFYAYNAYDPTGTHPEGPITFDTPDAIESLQPEPGIVPNFIAGADIDADGNWYGVEYAGGIYHIDYDGTMTFMGGSPGMNGLCFDSTTATWYGSGGGSLYTVDVLTGSSTVVGSHGITNTLIGIICDNNGDIYGYDVLFSGMSHLYSINKATGTATDMGALNIGFLYAQDPAYDRDNEIFYIAGYTQSGTSGLYILEGLTCTLVGAFEGGMEVDGFAIPWLPFQYDHDIAISGIVKPVSGNAGPITPIVKVKNTGLNTETGVQVQLDIGTELITGTVEDFEADNGSYIHFAKTTDSWQYGITTSGPGAAHSGVNVWATILAGSYPNSMWSGLKTQPFVVPAGVMFNYWQWYQFESGWDGGNVKISIDGGTTFTLITPVGGYPGTLSSNPYMTGQPGFTGTGGMSWAQKFFDLSAYEGETAIILWETASDSSVTYAGWYIDDVGFTETSWINEYSEIVTIPSIAPDETLEVSFPEWTPADLGVSENVNINYNAEATNLFADNNTINDYKEKAFTLHYGYLHDVAVTEIVSPQSGLAQTQTPEVTILNKGQNTENVNVHMNIGKALSTALLEEDFAGGVPPAGWNTTHPTNWMSSSTNYAGGTSPEAQFSWTPSSVGEHRLYTGDIDTTEYTALLLKFKEYVNDYNGDYDLKIQTSADGGATWSDAYVRTGSPYGPTTTEVALTAANGVGSATFRIAWDMSGDSFNINYWYVDDAWLGIIDMVEEYDETAIVDIEAGASVNVILPEWTPADISFAETIDYLITVNCSLNGSDGNPTDNQQSKLITLDYEHDVGVAEITYPGFDNSRQPPPGSWPIAGIIGNFGVTYSESNIPVNSKITNDTGIVIYDETVIIDGPLAPSENISVEFPEFTIPENVSLYGYTTLTMRTQLVGDDHPENDKKTFTWYVPPPPDTFPPVTNATVSGTIGQNEWFISNVTVTLHTIDYGPQGGYPLGVNNTFYKIDNGDWQEYTLPIIVDTDGYHIVYFYSDDNQIPPNVEKEKNISFKIDKTAPVITTFIVTAQNALKTIWLLEADATDATSGIMSVEFYADDAFVGNDTEAPYEFLVEQKISTAQCFVYDEAGNVKMSEVVTSYEYGSQQQYYNPRQVLQQKEIKRQLEAMT